MKFEFLDRRLHVNLIKIFSGKKLLEDVFG